MIIKIILTFIIDKFKSFILFIAAGSTTYWKGTIHFFHQIFSNTHLIYIFCQPLTVNVILMPDLQSYR